MEPRSAVVLVVDRWGAAFAGPYGNTWLETPNLNRLAAESLLWEFALTDCPRLETVYRSYWQGRHAMCSIEGDPAAALPAQLGRQSVETILVTDEPQVAQLPLAASFSDIVQLQPSEPSGLAADIDQTHLAGLFAAAIDRLQAASTPFLLWIHARGMQGPWDGPYELRAQFATEEDPPPPEIVEPPARRVEQNEDPDLLLGLVHAYAGQVALVDLCLGPLLDCVGERAEANGTLLAVTSPRGYPLGEHGAVGGCDEQLYGELLHVPWLVRFPDRAWATRRLHGLVQPPALCTTLLDWFGLPAAGGPAAASLLRVPAADSPPVPDRACAVLGQQRAIRTPAWFLRSKPPQHELFVKPDDRWEVNEVSDRCADVVEQLLALLDAFEKAAQAGQPAEFAPLDDVLREGLP